MVPDPAVMIIFARQLKTTRDPGVLYRRFVSNIQGIESIHLVGSGVSYRDELMIRHTVSTTNLFILSSFLHSFENL